MKKFVLLLLSLIALQASAQFSYSVKAGWSFPNIHHDDGMNVKDDSNFTMGLAVDYSINGYLGLQSGLNYKRISGERHSDVAPGAAPKGHVYPHASLVEIPFVFTASLNPAPERWRAIWNVGMFLDVPIEQKSPYNDYKTFYGIMAALQIEVLSHYFIRGEYQWGLSPTMDGEALEDRRTDLISVSLGYRF